jgi:hypothetical protein
VFLPEIKLLGTPGVSYRWVPGKKALVALETFGGGLKQFVRVDLDNPVKQTLIAFGLGSGILHFDVSPDGKQILYDVVRDNADVVVMDLP